MSDFLSQFSEKSYQSTTPRQVEQPQSVAIQGSAHDTVIDKSFHKNRLIRTLIIAAVVVALAVAGFFIFRISNEVEIKDLVGGSVEEAKTWALKNRIELNITEEFSLEYDRGIVFFQNLEKGKKIQKGSVMDITVSRGPDPDELLVLPNLSQINITELRLWIDQNKAYNVNVIQEYHDQIPEGRYIKHEFRDSKVSEKNYTRNDIMAIYMSKGVKPLNKDIVVPDFKEKTKAEVEQWATANGIKASFREEGSKNVASGMVISQSVVAGEKLAEGDGIEITISKGRGIAVPNFRTISRDSAAAAEPGLSINVETRYSTSVAYGGFISQSRKAGSVLYSTDDTAVTVVYSEGRPFIDNMIGWVEKDLAPYFFAFQSKGANITYGVAYVDSHEPKGTVVDASKNNEYVGMELRVDVKVSKGNLQPPTPPDSDPEG